MDNSRIILLENNISNDQIHMEKFSSSRGQKESFSEEGILVIRGDHEQEETKEIIFYDKDSSQKVNYVSGETILDTAIRNKIDIPFSCKEGICSTCKVELKDGQVAMAECGGLSDLDLERKYILSCQAKPKAKKVSVKKFS